MENGFDFLNNPSRFQNGVFNTMFVIDDFLSLTLEKLIEFELLHTYENRSFYEFDWRVFILKTEIEANTQILENPQNIPLFKNIFIDFYFTKIKNKNGLQKGYKKISYYKSKKRCNQIFVLNEEYSEFRLERVYDNYVVIRFPSNVDDIACFTIHPEEWCATVLCKVETKYRINQPHFSLRIKRREDNNSISQKYVCCLEFFYGNMNYPLFRKTYNILDLQHDTITKITLFSDPDTIDQLKIDLKRCLEKVYNICSTKDMLIYSRIPNIYYSLDKNKQNVLKSIIFNICDCISDKNDWMIKINLFHVDGPIQTNELNLFNRLIPEKTRTGSFKLSESSKIGEFMEQIYINEERKTKFEIEITNGKGSIIFFNSKTCKPVKIYNKKIDTLFKTFKRFISNKSSTDENFTEKNIYFIQILKKLFLDCLFFEVYDFEIFSQYYRKNLAQSFHFFATRYRFCTNKLDNKDKVHYFEAISNLKFYMEYLESKETSVKDFISFLNRDYRDSLYVSKEYIRLKTEVNLSEDNLDNFYADLFFKLTNSTNIFTL